MGASILRYAFVTTYEADTLHVSDATGFVSQTVRSTDDLESSQWVSELTMCWDQCMTDLKDVMTSTTKEVNLGLPSQIGVSDTFEVMDAWRLVEAYGEEIVARNEKSKTRFGNQLEAFD